MTGLKWPTLREANLLRLPEFKNRHGEPAHSEPDGSDWSDNEWLEAVIGELGEYANVAKKLRRGDLSRMEALPMLADELADVACYLDILAFRVGCDLGEAMRKRFDTEAITVAFDTPFGGPADRLRAVVSHLGGFASFFRAREGGLSRREELSSVAYCLSALAHVWGIDLGAAVISKFNRVSIRVGSTVRISEAGCFRADKEEK